MIDYKKLKALHTALTLYLFLTLSFGPIYGDPLEQKKWNT